MPFSRLFFTLIRFTQSHTCKKVYILLGVCEVVLLMLRDEGDVLKSFVLTQVGKWIEMKQNNRHLDLFKKDKIFLWPEIKEAKRRCYSPANIKNEKDSHNLQRCHKGSTGNVESTVLLRIHGVLSCLESYGRFAQVDHQFLRLL